MLKGGFKKIAAPRAEPTVAVIDARDPGMPSILTDEPADDDADTPVEVDRAPRATDAHYPELSEKFLLAGKALFTVSNPKGEHYTFKVRARTGEWPLGSGKESTTYFVSVKAPGGVYPFRYVGLLREKTGDIKVTAKSEFLPGTKEYDIAKWAASAVISQKMIPAGYHIEHAGRCGKCGRTLTDPQSIQRGIGPECWKSV